MPYSPAPSSYYASPTPKLTRSSSQLFQQNNCEPFIFAQSLTSVCLDPSSAPPNEWSPAELIVPPPSTSSSMPAINMQSFQSYLSKISSVYKLFNDNQHMDLIPTNRKTSDEIISLDSIPEFFFRKNLTKIQILEYANSDPSPIMFQKLEHYSTIVEENIVGHIREQSQSFFHAMSDLKQFRMELSQLYQELLQSRRMLHKVDNEVVKSSLNISRLYLQKHRTIDAIQRLSLIADVKAAQPTLQLLLSKGDYGGALDLVQSTQTAVSTTLGSVAALKHLSPQLIEMVKLIEKMLQADFIGIALNDDLLLQHDEEAEADDLTQPRKISALDSPMMKATEATIVANLDASLLPIIDNLLRIGRLQEVLDAFREAAVENAQEHFRAVVAAAAHELDHDERTPASRGWEESKARILKLSPTDSIPLFKMVNVALKKKMLVAKKILDLIAQELSKLQDDTAQDSEVGGATSPSSLNSHRIFYSCVEKNQIEAIKSLCNNILYAVNETMQEKIASLVKARSEANARLALPDFVVLNQHINSFIDFSERVLVQTKKKVTPLRSIQLSQSKQFLDTLHKNRISSLTLLLENEEWTPVQVVSEFQTIVNHLVDVSLAQVSPVLGPEATNSLDNTVVVPPSEQQIGISDDILISGEKFKVGNTSLMLLKFLNDYINCIEKLPSLIIDSIPKLIELLHTFNGMTYQLVLGAGARQLMKLKTITSKHLGLASQCLSFQIKLIPYLKTVLQRYLQSKTQLPLLNGFDKMIQDFTSHRTEIFNKFVSILKERSIAHSKVLMTMDLRDDSLPIPSPPIAALLKDYSTLHKLLNNLLPPDQMFKVFMNIYYMFNNLFIESLAKIDLSHKASRRRIHNDTLHLMASLRQLPNTGDPVGAFAIQENRQDVNQTICTSISTVEQPLRISSHILGQQLKSTIGDHSTPSASRCTQSANLIAINFVSSLY
eukprot:gene2290-2597_t